MKAIRVILACIRTADDKFNLINDGDRICLGISGGKDSMAMFYALHLYKKFSKTKFDIFPCIIDLGFDDFNPAKIKNFIESLGYKLDVADGKTVYEILKIQKENMHSPNLPCSICSKMKKAIINKEAHKLNCNKVAFAHHRDDAIETLFLNEIYGGRISTFSPKMFLSKEKITFIRPLVLAKEEDLRRLCDEENIPICPSHCPNDKHTEREVIKGILNNIYGEFPSSRENFLNMLFNDTKEDIFYSHVEHKIEGTQLFITRTINKDDLIDEFKFENGLKPTNLDKSMTHYVLHNDKGIRAIIYLSTDKEARSFTISHYKYKNKKEFMIFIKEIANIYFFNYNPCALHVCDISKNDITLFEKAGFKKQKNKKYILLLTTKK